VSSASATGASGASEVAVDVVENEVVNVCDRRCASLAAASATWSRASASPYLPAALSATERWYWASDAKYLALACREGARVSLCVS